MSKFYGHAPSLGHFWTGKRIFLWEFQYYLKLFFISVNHGVSGDVSIQMPTKMPLFEAFNCSNRRKSD
jgi:hypothetical protein